MPSRGSGSATAEQPELCANITATPTHPEEESKNAGGLVILAKPGLALSGSNPERDQCTDKLVEGKQNGSFPKLGYPI